MAETYIRPPADEANFNFDVADYVSPAPLEANFDFAIAVFYVLAGNSNIFTAIWADANASKRSGKMYALSYGPGAALSVVDIEQKNLYDYYTQNSSGRVDETLTDNDTVDLNVSTP